MLDSTGQQFNTIDDEDVEAVGPGFVVLNQAGARRRAQAASAKATVQNSAFQDFLDWLDALGDDQKKTFTLFENALKAAHGNSLLSQQAGMDSSLPVFQQRKFLFEKLETTRETQSGAQFKMAGSNGYLDIGAQGVRFVSNIQGAKNNDIGFTYADAQMMALHAAQNASWAKVKLTGTREQRHMLQLAITEQNKHLPPEQQIKIQNPVRLAFSKPKDFTPFEDFIAATKSMATAPAPVEPTTEEEPSAEAAPAQEPEQAPVEPAVLSPEEQSEKDFEGMQTWLEYQKPAELKKPENLYATMNGQDVYSYGTPGSDEYALYTFGENNKPYLLYLNVKGRAISLDGFDTELASAFHEDLKYRQKKAATFAKLEDTLKADPESATAKELKLPGAYGVPFRSVYRQTMDVNGTPADVYYAAKKDRKSGEMKFDVVKVKPEGRTAMDHDTLYMKNDEAHPRHPENVYRQIIAIAKQYPEEHIQGASPETLFNKFHELYGDKKLTPAREKFYAALGERLDQDLSAPAPEAAPVMTNLQDFKIQPTPVSVDYSIGGAFDAEAKRGTSKMPPLDLRDYAVPSISAEMGKAADGPRAESSERSKYPPQKRVDGPTSTIK